MSQLVRILVDVLHRGRFLKVGDIVPADGVLLELCKPINRYQQRQFCEVIIEEQEPVVEQPEKEKKSRKKSVEPVPVPENIEEIIHRATEGAF